MKNRKLTESEQKIAYCIFPKHREPLKKKYPKLILFKRFRKFNINLI